MNKLIIPALCALSLTLGASAAVAGGDYYGSYGSGNYGGAYGDRYNGGYYGRGGYGDYYGGRIYDRYQRYLRTCRQHSRFHSRLNEAHQEGDELGYYGYHEHGDYHDALRGAHRSYHRAHPSSNYCMTYNQYRTRYGYGGYRGNRGYGGYGGYGGYRY
ncbi:MAG: hypothetical protein ACT4OG_08410 [Alphaproteobacteria bacterium]